MTQLRANVGSAGEASYVTDLSTGVEIIRAYEGNDGSGGAGGDGYSGGGGGG